MSSHANILSDDAPLDLRLSESELDRTHDHLVSFIRETVDAAGAEGATLGLSGGIDSAALYPPKRFSGPLATSRRAGR